MTTTDEERAVLDVAHRYVHARYDAFHRAQEGTQRDADARAAGVQRLVEELLETVLRLPPGLHPNDAMVGPACLASDRRHLCVGQSACPSAFPAGRALREFHRLEGKFLVTRQLGFDCSIEIARHPPAPRRPDQGEEERRDQSPRATLRDGPYRVAGHVTTLQPPA